jgi:hypothetical protein
VLANHSVVVFDTEAKRVLINTSALDPTTDKVGRSRVQVSTADWQYFQETVGYGAKTTTATRPEEQLLFTDNDSDYLWYTTVVKDGIPAGMYRTVLGAA